MRWDRISVGQVSFTATFVWELRSYTDTGEVYCRCVCVWGYGLLSCSTCLSAMLNFHLFSCSTVSANSLPFCFLCHQVSRCTSFFSLPFLIRSLKDTSTRLAPTSTSNHYWIIHDSMPFIIYLISLGVRWGGVKHGWWCHLKLITESTHFKGVEIIWVWVKEKMCANMRLSVYLCACWLQK